MNDSALMICLMLLAGLALGLSYFGGLRLTTIYMVRIKRPWLLALSSFIVRSGIFLVLLFWLGKGQWQRMGLILTGFIIARFFLMGSIAVKPQEAEAAAERSSTYGA